MTIYPSITTTSKANCKKQIADVKKLKLKQVCLFPTTLDYKNRKKLYKLLETTSIEKIPLVHLKNDMKIDELEYFVKKYKTCAFNIHVKQKHPLQHDLSKYKNKIFVENSPRTELPENELKEWSGICIDFSHLECERLRNGLYKEIIKLIKKYKCSCCHLGPISKKPIKDKHNQLLYTTHHYKNLQEFDYIKKYKKYLPSIVALEIENTIPEQLKAKKYIEKLIK